MFIKSFTSLLTIITYLGLVKAILYFVALNCRGESLLYYLVDHVLGIIYLLSFKNNVPQKLDLRY